MSKLILIIAIGICSQEILASDRGLKNFIVNEIERAESAFGDMENNLNIEVEQGDQAYYFRRFWLRIRPKGGFEVPELSKLEVIPEVEMLFEKELPDGWIIYKP